VRGQKHLARLLEITRKYWYQLATVSIGAGVSLGVYTGILLGSSVARPLWNSAALGPLFLASGISGAAALLALLERDHEVRTWFTRADIWALLAEVLLIVAFIIGHATGTRCHIDALGLIFGGPFTAPFWGLVVTLGIMVPLVLEWLEIKRKVAATAIVPLLVLLGAIALRYVILTAGQAAGVGGDAPLNVFF
jgi:formate-dependent nitrite reductase membrane component NrfD